jgi:predicted nucleic acid-binding protein
VILVDASVWIAHLRGDRMQATANLIIGTFCIERGHSLLHDDRDFALMERHLGLKVV